MIRVLFVTNGHGEAAIADRISLELAEIAPGASIDHLALVGELQSRMMRDVGPRRAMPSGGLIAMGNVRNLAQDLCAGLIPLTWAQANFLRGARGKYDAAVAVGDVYALAMTLLARTRTVFVGTAKSVAVARYGRFEERILRRASACFVRDAATAGALRRNGLKAEAANAIVDLFAMPDDTAAERAIEGFAPALALFPGSRESAYDDGAFLLDVTRGVAAACPSLGAALSVSGGLDAERFAVDAERGGWNVRRTSDEEIPFVLSWNGREIVRAWRGALGPLLTRVTLVLGQAGTANEAAAAGGVPIVAFERDRDRKVRWYRERQRGLLGDALAVFPGRLEDGVAGVRTILEDHSRRRHMGEAGRTRMGASGGARRIAERLAALAEGT
ncbi:MAG TPA: hypothetical protein VFE35_06350 [Candidatus Cybelea sp.]|jgi:uncharacterized protein (TIGR03492 family)|nr:hypothetical protein [Candidatus Cybelea sp.]